MKAICYCLFLSLFFVINGCTDNNSISPLYFEKEYYEKPLLDNLQEITFSGGSGNFSVDVSDINILEASISENKLKVKTKKKGSAFVIVKDNSEDKIVTIEFKVVDRYLCLRFIHPIPDSSYYKDGDILFLVNGDDTPSLLFDNSFNLRDKGSYQLFRKDDKFYLSMSYSECLFLYDISTSSSIFLFKYLPYFLNASWTNGMFSYSSREVNMIGMTAVDLETNNIYYFVVDDNIEMPYGILD